MEQLICSNKIVVVAGWDLSELSKPAILEEEPLLKDNMSEFANCETFLQEYVEIHAASQVTKLDFIEPH